MSDNREHKDSVFTKLFGEPEKMIELYNALSGNSFPLDTPLEVATLKDALFKGLLNDLAFVIQGKLVILIEHQSTINENMPLRFLFYIAKVYERMTDRKAIYRSKLIKLPQPEFYVLYNGTEELPDKQVLRLSGAFLEHPESRKAFQGGCVLELEATIINVNAGHNDEIIRKSANLSGYVTFVNKVRELMASGLGLDTAILKAIEYCISNEILAEFLDNNSREVRNMLFTEFDLDTAMEVWREEGMEKGMEKGIKEGEAKIINALRKTMSIVEIARLTDLPVEEIEALTEGQPIS